MKVFETRQIREIDAYTIRHEPVASVDLMERAAQACVDWIGKNIGRPVPVRVFIGPGNNGGDGWAIARLLAARGYADVVVFPLQISHIITTDSSINRGRLISQGIVPVHEICTPADFPSLQEGTVVIDALFGSGLSRPLEGLPAALVSFLNDSGCRILAIDIPSGLMGEDNSENKGSGIIRASDTLTFHFPKRSFFFAENAGYTGRWHILPIGLHEDIISDMPSAYHYTTSAEVQGLIHKRPQFSHKGNFGHGLLIAGSYGMAGAAILAAGACLRSGIGLLTTHVPRLIYPIVQGSFPESIFSIDPAEEVFSQCPALTRFSAVAIGPGLGTKQLTRDAFETLIRSAAKPLLVDADGLNLLAAHPEWISLLPENTILTPHPGEFDRLAGPSENGYRRNLKQIAFSQKHQLIVVLKGAFTSITMPDGQCHYNSTGNPGMAKAGSGDVLTGILLSLLAQGYAQRDAAILGAYLHGLAGDLAADACGEQGMIASDLIHYLGNAFKKLEYDETILRP
jgi:NAD(P)H-hydrate epimerase